MKMKMKMALLSMVLGIQGCATESALRIKPDPVVSATLAEVAAAKKPLLAEDALAEMRLAARAAQPAPAKPQVAEPRFNLIVKDLSPSATYQVIGEQSHMNVIVASEIKDPITISLKGVTVVEALESLREAYGLEFELSSNRIVINKPRIQSKIFQIDYLVGTRSGKSEVKVSSSGVGDSGNNANPSGGMPGSGLGGAINGANGSNGSGGKTGTEGSRVTTVIYDDFWHSLDVVLKSIISGKDGQAVVLNPQSGLVYVKGFPAQIREIDEYLTRTQVKVSRQVVLEAKIVEVTLSSGSQGGINWASFDHAGNHRFSVGGNPSTIYPQGGGFLTPTALGGASGFLNSGGALPNVAGLGVAFTGTSFAALMSFLQSQGETQVLSAPRVATMNNQKAVLKVGTDEFFVTNVTSTSTSTGTTTTNAPSINVQPFFSGIALDVTPQIDDNGYVVLHVHPSVSDVAEKSKVINLGGLGTYTLPLASSNINESDTVVRLLDGDIVAIGGLMSSTLHKSGQKIPLVGDVPIAGELFKQHSDSLRKTELVILIKPTVINKPGDWTASAPNSGVGK